ncbi:SLATT domain-containing protein [Pseudomonas aeruginosa]|nr:SLATT domain-containing protein [Pseudomonas aeruginosa]
MEKATLLKMIAERGYDAGYCAKLHFSTFDIVEKVPGWVGLLTTVIGIFALVVPDFESKIISASMVAIGVTTLYINFYNDKKSEYFEAGRKLALIYDKLKKLHAKVKVASPEELVAAEAEFDRLSSEIHALCMSKHIFSAGWLAHKKFFWEQQTDWIEEDRTFSFYRDKIPMSVYLFVLAAFIGLIAYKYMKAGCLL